MFPRGQRGWIEFGASRIGAGGWARQLARRSSDTILGMEQFNAFSNLRSFSFDPQKPAMFPRRIVYVLKVFPKLSETFVAEELAELRRRGIELRILSMLPARSGLRHDIVVTAGLEQITNYERKDFLSIVQGFRPQLLHAHFATEATAMAIELGTEQGIPFTFTA